MAQTSNLLDLLADDEEEDEEEVQTRSTWAVAQCPHLMATLLIEQASV